MKDITSKIKSFFVRNKKKIGSFLLLASAVVAVSLITLALLMAFDIVYFEGTDMHFNLDMFESFRTSWYGWLFFILLQIVLTMLLCVIPGVSMAFILLSQTIYPVTWQAFLLCFVSVMTASSVMYCIGRFGGYKLCVRLLGEEDCEKSLGLLRDKGTVYFPFMMMFPAFPDEALTMIAGTMKMKLVWFIPSIVIGRGIGIAMITFGLSSVPFEKFTSVWHWVIFIAVCAAFVVGVFLLARCFKKYLEKRKIGTPENE